MKFLFRLLRRLFKICFRLGLIVVVPVLIIALVHALTRDIERPATIPAPSYILVGGRQVADFGGGRTIVPYDELPQHLVDAVVACEDQRFWDHFGIDPIGIARAVFNNVRSLYSSMSIRGGAGTISMQLGRVTYGVPDKGLMRGYRKVFESWMALRLENHYEKEEILQHYLNRVYFGDGYYGIHAAAAGYFGKPPKNLTLGESAFLAGVLPSPDNRNHGEQALRSRDIAIGRLIAEGKLEDSHRNSPEIRFYFRPTEREVRSELSGYVLGHARREIVRLRSSDPKLDRAFAQGGLQVHLTIDLKLQNEIEDAQERRLRRVENSRGYANPKFGRPDAKPTEHGTPYLQASIVVLDNTTGGILAMTGGREYRDSQFCRATQAQRPTVSCFKPFVVGSALESGAVSAAQRISDAPLKPGEIDGAGSWSPRNFDGVDTGFNRIDTALSKSRNLVLVRVGNAAGITRVAKTARAFGLGEIDRVPSSYLGSSSCDNLSLTAAFGVFANGGLHRQPSIIAKITNGTETIYEHRPTPRRVIASKHAVEIAKALRQTLTTGTGKKARQLGWSVPISGGKTGTGTNFADARFVGFDDRITAGVWVGMDNGSTIMKDATGSAVALPLWVDVMRAGLGRGR